MERWILGITAAFLEWLKSQDSKIVLTVFFLLASSTFLIYQQRETRADILLLQNEIEQLRDQIIACETERSAMSVEIKYLKEKIEEASKHINGENKKKKK